MGTAGTRKSYLINNIWRMLQETTKKYRLHENSIVLAPTGVAAPNIESSTIHLALSILICEAKIKLEGDL